MSGELSSGETLWPFGKYRGQAIGRAMADHTYMEWVLNQPWFMEEYAHIHKLIVNFGSEAQDSPEHNEFQIRFLGEDVREALARRLGFKDLTGETYEKRRTISKRVAREMSCAVQERESPLSVSAVSFEDQGWDVSFYVKPASYVSWISAELGKPYIELLEGWSMDGLAAKAKERLRGKPNTLDVSVYEPNSSRRTKVLIELKPDLGDDYPSVLRQIQRYPVEAKGRTRKVLLVRRARFTTVSAEQVKAFFQSADITLLMEWELETPTVLAGNQLSSTVIAIEPLAPATAIEAPRDKLIAEPVMATVVDYEAEAEDFDWGAI